MMSWCCVGWDGLLGVVERFFLLFLSDWSDVFGI